MHALPEDIVRRQVIAFAAGVTSMAERDPDRSSSLLFQLNPSLTGTFSDFNSMPEARACCTSRAAKSSSA